ncbi:hypothetical protein N0P75_04010 [Citrobacter youngae]|uniref:hypothetical protein n=2 Tax=Enterobacteriaceae TaxID=543 RepID=UPI000EF1BBD2|nr:MULTISPECIES: hypothetical protein [Citrobacter]AYL61408.1 hypothetical protein CUC49_07050 [Citrobacter pasteurii]MBA8106367.1 hypothetical protein [Citrobacter sp. RHBSTW-00029]NHM10131.1 hypothetical protein [Citrobacter youngae]
MTLNEFSSTTASIFGNFEKIIRMLKSISDPKYITVANRRRTFLENMSEHISIINKFHPFAHAEFFTKEEKENIFSLLKLTDNYISSMISDIFSDDIYRSITTINDDLIRYSRISKFIQGTHNQPNTIAMFKNQASNEIAKVVDLKNEIEISATQIRELAERNANSHDKIIKLVTDLNAETKKLESAGSEIEFILKKSRDALIGIESSSEKLRTVEETLNNIVNANKSMQGEIIKKSAESASEIKNLLDKKTEIEELKTIISGEINNAKELNSKANSALNLSGTYRLSRHFRDAYKTANKNKRFWAFVSIGAAIVCIAFVVYMLVKMNEVSSYPPTDQEPNLLLLFFARFSMIPVLIGFFAFSAIQYVKQNNISEDYAHKKLLSETLVSFKQEINKNDTDKSSLFMDNILKSVLRSPLSSIDKKSHQMEIDKINELINTTSKINKEIIDRVLPEKEKEK